ncbi:MAG: glycosyltransferase [Deltaproteobacteria bacterium]|nr:glycosyltransferase [Deltaproteobacteria bacterium]
MIFPVLVKVWAGNRAHDFRYIRRSLLSLLDSGLPDAARLILINDCSTDWRVERFLTDCAKSFRYAEVWVNPYRMGPNKGQEYNVPRVLQRFPGAPYYVLCDDDIIYHPGWLQRLVQVYDEAKATGLNGVFTALNIPYRPSFRCVRLPTSEVLLKNRQAALNWLLPRDVYQAVGPFRDVGIAYDSEYCNRMSALEIPVICLKPSYVQNIGYHGAYQTDDTYTARDFVGRRDLWLFARDFLYGLNRSISGRAQQFVERLPDGPPKQKGVVLARRIRRWFLPIN